MRRRALAAWLSVVIAGCGGGELDALRQSAAVPAPTTSGTTKLPVPAGDTLTSGSLTLTLRDDGTFDVSRGGDVVIQRATADALIDDGTKDGRLVSLASSTCVRTRESAGVMRCQDGALTLRLELLAPAGKRFFTARADVTNGGADTVVVRRVAPLALDASSGGALVLGQDPSHHRILENGRFIAFDQTAQISLGDTKRFPLGQALDLPLRGSSVSNWSHAVVDLDDPSRSLVAGYLTFERAVPTLGIGADASMPSALFGGRSPFTSYAADSVFVFHGKPLAQGASVPSELLYVDVLPDDPVRALETYADALGASQGIVPFTKRGGGHAVPGGWNSWSGGSSTGGYGQDIDQSLVLASMSVFQSELLPFGDTLFPIDDGWQLGKGDWRFDPVKFPLGSKGMADTIRAAGLTPGLWLAPFAADAGGALATAHPDWLAPAEDGLVGTFHKDPSLDLSNPDVLAYLKDLFGGLRDDGYSWIKGDFTYLALLGKPISDPTLTNVEAFRAGWRVIRDALGPDVFLEGIGLIGLHVGVVDGMRLTLDNGPKWDEENPDSVIDSPRAMKATVRTGSRRWFYQNRVWLNHDDLIFFRAWPDATIPPITLEESRTFATWVALGGGSVEVGDKLLDMEAHPEWLDVVRRLLPSYPDAATPLDVMTRDYPERYALHVASPAGEWDVVGLFHWGTNRDFSVTPPAAMTETTRTFTVACPAPRLVYEMWSETFLGLQTADFQVSVDPRRTKVLALRVPTGAPQLLGSNRHVTQGATDMGPVTWDESARVLRGTIVGAPGSAAAPFTYDLAFYVPAGFSMTSVTVSSSSGLSTSMDGQVLRLRFVATSTAPMSFAIGF